jgi:Xaa-Pro dipeptidase
MNALELDSYISFDPINIYYLTNFANVSHERPFLLIIPGEGTPTMLAPLLERSHIESRARRELELATYYEFPAPSGENWNEVLARLIDGSARVGIESAMPMGIAGKIPGRHVVKDIIDEARLIKSDYEIGRAVHTCNIMSEAHRKLLEMCKPGTPEIALIGEVNRVIMGRVFQEIPNANIIVTRVLGGVWPPAISHDPHLIPKPTTPMEEGGPHVTIINGQIDGAGAEVERTFFLGHVPEGAKRPFEIMMEARDTAYELAKPGAVLSEIDAKVRQVIIDGGYEKGILHRTGHGFGITGHEAPFIALGDDRELAPGMLVSIEPGIYLPGTGGFRHSDTVRITEDGPVCLTEAPDRLEELTF